MEPASLDRTDWARNLIGVEIALWDRLDARLRRDLDITLAIFESLRFVERSPAGSLRVGELASKLHVSIGGASKLVDRMEQAGLIRRQADDTDRRASRVHLTGKGAQHLAAAREAYEDELALAIDPVLGAEERHRMTGELQRLLAHLRTMSKADRSGAQ